jgi:aspartyl/glutamyl-tRNA(Asn/Gln) amidotransferase C subunit
MKFLTTDTIQQLAKAARLRVAPKDEQACGEKINAVLDYAATLMQEIPLAAVENPQEIRPEQELILRRDQARPCDPEIILQGAPAREERFFVVPVVISQ